MQKFILIALMALGAVSANAQSTATLRGIDVYRSNLLTEAEARKRFEIRLRQYVSYRNQALPSGDEKAEALRLEMEKEVAGMPGIKSVELHVSEYFTSTDHAMYAMFDVVDVADATRLASLRLRTGSSAIRMVSSLCGGPTWRSERRCPVAVNCPTTGPIARGITACGAALQNSTTIRAYSPRSPKKEIASFEKFSIKTPREPSGPTLCLF